MSDITVDKLILERLPELYAAQAPQILADAPAIGLRVASSGTTGAQPCQYRIQATRQGLETKPVEALGPDNVDLLVRQNENDLRSVFDDDPNLPGLLPPGMSPVDFLFLDPLDKDLIRNIRGRFQVTIKGLSGRRFTLDAGVLKEGILAGRPKVTVTTDIRTYAAICDKSLAPLPP